MELRSLLSSMEKNLKRLSPREEKYDQIKAMPLKFTKSRFLVCEGDDDKGFLETLIRDRGLPEFQVCHAAECNDKGVGGRSAFKHSLSGLAPITGFDAVRAILIVTDNDTAGSFTEVRDALIENGHTAPGTANEVGSIHGKPVAVLMIPSSAEHGDLEVLCLPEILRRWPEAAHCVAAFLTCTHADRWTKQSSINKARARSATVAFNEDEPYMGIGNLFRKGTLSVANPCFDEVVGFFQNFDHMCGI